MDISLDGHKMVWLFDAFNHPSHLYLPQSPSSFKKVWPSASMVSSTWNLNLWFFFHGASEVHTIHLDSCVFSPWDMKFSELGIFSRINMSIETDNWNYMKSSTDIVVSGSRKTCSTTPAIDGNDDWHHGLITIQSHQNFINLMGAHGSWMGFESNLRISSLVLCFCWYFL